MIPLFLPLPSPQNTAPTPQPPNSAGDPCVSLECPVYFERCRQEDKLLDDVEDLAESARKRFGDGETVAFDAEGAGVRLRLEEGELEVVEVVEEEEGGEVVVVEEGEHVG